jgi:hypothetical protein
MFWLQVEPESYDEPRNRHRQTYYSERSNREMQLGSEIDDPGLKHVSQPHAEGFDRRVCFVFSFP